MSRADWHLVAFWGPIPITPMSGNPPEAMPSSAARREVGLPALLPPPVAISGPPDKEKWSLCETWAKSGIPPFHVPWLCEECSAGSGSSFTRIPWPINRALGVAQCMKTSGNWGRCYDRHFVQGHFSRSDRVGAVFQPGMWRCPTGPQRNPSLNSSIFWAYVLLCLGTCSGSVAACSQPYFSALRELFNLAPLPTPKKGRSRIANNDPQTEQSGVFIVTHLLYVQLQLHCEAYYLPNLCGLVKRFASSA